MVPLRSQRTWPQSQVRPVRRRLRPLRPVIQEEYLVLSSANLGRKTQAPPVQSLQDQCEKNGSHSVSLEGYRQVYLINNLKKIDEFLAQLFVMRQ